MMKASGEAVKADEAIVELETDKVTLEVPPVNGVLSDIVATRQQLGRCLTWPVEEGAVFICFAKSREACCL